MGSDKSGAKLSTSEYATRKIIDVVSAVAVPVVGYFAIVYGPDLVEKTKAKINKIRNRKQ